MAPKVEASISNAVTPIKDSQNENMKKSPKKTYIPIRIRTNAMNNDDIAIAAAYISAEDLSARDVEVRYLDSIKSLRDKIKSSFCCSQEHCPVIQQRLERHQMLHHAQRLNDPQKTLAFCPDCRSRTKQPTLNNSPAVSKRAQEEVSTGPLKKTAITITPAASILKRCPNDRCTDSQTIHTPSKSVDFNHTVQTSIDGRPCDADRRTQYRIDSGTSIDHGATDSTRKSFSREELEEQIHNCVKDLPMYTTLPSDSKNLRRKQINQFIDKIYDLSNDVTKVDYERNVKAEVDNFLNDLPMWYPGTKRDQDELKEGIKNKLMTKIKRLSERRNKIPSSKYVDDIANTDWTLADHKSMNQLNEDEKEKIIESEVLDWLMQIKFKESDEIGRTINIIDATDIFTKRLKPILDKPSTSKNYKLILKGLIVDTLNDLPNVLHYPKNKRCYFNRIAENLTNRLINIQSKYKRGLNHSFSKERSMYQLAVCSKSSLKQYILDGLNECLKSASIEHRQDVKEEITDILIDCLESVRFKEDLEVKDELINNVLGNCSVEISETQTSDFTIENIREILADDIIKSAEYSNKGVLRSCQSGTIPIFTSEHELSGKYPITSTPKQRSPIRQETAKLNSEEVGYMDRVSSLIRNWMETLPNTFNKEEEKSFKDIMITDLAADILDQLKLEQLAPTTTPDRDKFMFYIIFRWLFRFEVYEDLNDAMPQVDNLVMRLHEIPVPTLTMPQGGNRQAMANIKHMEGDLTWKEKFVPASIDVLEDEISIWMNEQPPDIYAVKDKDYQNKMVQELAGSIKNKISSNAQEQDLDNDLSKWLKIMLKSSEKKNIEKLRENLKDRIMKLPKSKIVVKQTSNQTSAISHSNSSLSDISPPKHADDKISESETSQISSLSNRTENKKDIVSNSWFGCQCPLTSKDSKTPDSELSQDAKYSTNEEKDKRKRQSDRPGMTGASELEQSQDEKLSDNKDNENKKQESESSQDSTYSQKQHDKHGQPKPTQSNTSTNSKDVNTSASETSQGSKSSNTTMHRKNDPKNNQAGQYDKNVKTTGRQKSASVDCKCPKKGKAKHFDKKQYSSINKTATRASANNCICPHEKSKSKSHPNINTHNSGIDNERTLTKYIGKYMEHNNDADDNMTKGAFGEILQTEFRKLDPPTRKEVYDSYATDKSHDDFSPERLDKELKYIQDISDWLKNIPIDGSYNTPQNKERIEFVNDLARDIYNIEEDRRNKPSETDYNSLLISKITEYTEKLPILPEHSPNIVPMVNQLVSKVAGHRTPMPCCISPKMTTSSMNSSGIPEQNISQFVDNYIRLNADEIANDPVKFDAWSARILKDAKKIIRDSADPSTLCKTQIYNKLVNTSIPEEESIRLFGLELDYAKEISEWMNNLPLQPITTTEASQQRVKMISELAENFAEIERSKLINPNETQSKEEVEAFITRWIRKLPLDSKKEIVFPVVIEQLLNRIERVNKRPQVTIDRSTNTTMKLKSKGKGKHSRTCKPSCCSTGGKAGQLVVEAIETWSNNLPVKAENKDAEKNIKDGVAKRLFQKVGDLSVDPEIMNDDQLYREMLTNEIDQELNQLPQSSDMVKKKENLKKTIVDKVMEAKGLAKESVSGENYKEQLETTIDASIPNPVPDRQIHDPGFEIYKNHMAEMFILENFDHGNDEDKLKYENNIKKEIDKHCQDALTRNTMPLTKEQMYSELYAALFKVPMPCESSITEEVEEVKTRCEISEWFQALPLQEASDENELLKRDRIQTTLAKRIHEIERKEHKPDEKIHKEITKWLVKLPLLPGNEEDVDKLANELQSKLNSTKEARKRVLYTDSPNKSSKCKGILGTSQVAGPSSAGQAWVTPPPSSQPSCQQPVPRKKAADIILEIVENWCESLPFYENSQKSREMNRTIRDDLGTKIIIKICELNGDPEKFSDDLLYNYLLDDELEKLMANLPFCCDFQPTKDYKKEQLKQAITSVKPLFKEEKARHDYKKELNTTVNNVLKEPLDLSSDKIAQFNELREEIVENYVQLQYHRDDDEGRQIYKEKLRDAVLKYLLEVQDEQRDSGVDPLMKQNQLLCELGKIPVPNERAIKDEVDEVRMKNEVKQFFEEQSLNDVPEEKITAVNNIKLSLAKRLNDIEKTGHNCTNDALMKKEIKRHLTKLSADVDGDEIESFVDHLKATEAARKAVPVYKDDANNHCQNKERYRNYNAENDSSRRVCNGETSNISRRQRDSRPAVSELCCPQAYVNSTSLGVTPVEYPGFGGGVAISSSPRPNNDQSQSPTLTNAEPNPTPTNIPTNQGERSDGRFTANKRKRQRTTDNEETEDECRCLDGRERQKMRGRPRCVLRRPQFCNDCDDYGPMWMPMPPFRYPPGYFYF